MKYENMKQIKLNQFFLFLALINKFAKGISNADLFKKIKIIEAF